MVTLGAFTISHHVLDLPSHVKNQTLERSPIGLISEYSITLWAQTFADVLLCQHVETVGAHVVHYALMRIGSGVALFTFIDSCQFLY